MIGGKENDELFKRLRDVDGNSPYLNHNGVARLCHEAADEIEHLQEHIRDEVTHGAEVYNNWQAAERRAAELQSKLDGHRDLLREIEERFAQLQSKLESCEKDKDDTERRLKTAMDAAAYYQQQWAAEHSRLEACEIALKAIRDDAGSHTVARRDGPHTSGFAYIYNLTCDALSRPVPPEVAAKIDASIVERSVQSEGWDANGSPVE